MTHPSPDSNRAIRPIPTVPVAALHTAPTVAPPAPEDDSFAPDAGTHGYTISADTADAMGLPPERRPLTLHAIRMWTVASLVGSLSFATIVAIVHSHSDSVSDRTENAPALATQSTRGDFLPREPSASAAPPPPVIPLSALPKVGAEATCQAGAAKNHKIAAHTARKTAAVPAKETKPHQATAAH